jgi:LysM repeat protein
VQKGETLSAIAPKYGMSISSILDLNPKVVEPSKLAIGDELTVSKAVSRLSVRATVTKEYDEGIPYEIEKVKDDSLYVNEKKVVTPGVEGQTHIKRRTSFISTERKRKNHFEARSGKSP